MEKQFSFKCFKSELSDRELLLSTDNSTAMAYINKVGGVQNRGLN